MKVQWQVTPWRASKPIRAPRLSSPLPIAYDYLLEEIALG